MVTRICSISQKGGPETPGAYRNILKVFFRILKTFLWVNSEKHTFRSWRHEKNLSWEVYSSPRAVVTNCHKLCGLKQKFIFPQFQGSEVWNKCIGRATVPLKTRRESFFASSSFWWLQAFLYLWLHNSSLHLHMTFPSSLYVSTLSLIRILVVGSSAHLDNPKSFHLKILNYTCKGPFKKSLYSWFLGCDHIFEEIFIQPATESYIIRWNLGSSI